MTVLYSSYSSFVKIPSAVVELTDVHPTPITKELKQAVLVTYLPYLLKVTGSTLSLI